MYRRFCLVMAAADMHRQDAIVFNGILLRMAVSLPNPQLPTVTNTTNRFKKRYFIPDSSFSLQIRIACSSTP